MPSTTINPSDQKITQYNIQTGGASNLLNNVAPSSTSGVPVISQGAAAQPIFGTAVVAGGGTGVTAFTSHSGLICGGTSDTGTLQQVASVATGQVLISAGTSTLPAFSATPSVTSITFGSGTALSVYQEGTFTPTLDGAVSGTTTYTVQQGYYTKIGNMVTVWVTITITAATGTGNAILGALPFTVKNQTGYTVAGTITIANASGWTWPVGTTQATIAPALNTTTATIVCGGSAVASGVLQMTNAAATFRFNVAYQV